MIAAAVLLLAQASAVQGAVLDAATRAPVPAAAVQAPAARARTDAEGRFLVRAAPGDTVRVLRVGYRPAVAVVGAGDLLVLLHPMALRLDAVAVRDSGDPARLVARRAAETARADGALTAADAVAALPFVSARGGRAGLQLSMRGSRAEQVLVVLDGMPLNDPATGAADLGDVPLAALGTVAAHPGADAARWGTGASGGVVALSSGHGSLGSVSGGSFGARSLEGRTSLGVGGWRVHGGGAVARARNDYELTVDRSRRGLPDSTARRSDADEERLALFGGLAGERLQLSLFASRVDRGLARPVGANVAAQREERRRLAARGQLAIGGWTLSGGTRALAVRYEDPSGIVSASEADSRSLDAELARRAAAVQIRAGAGTDRVSGTRLTTTERPRAFASLAIDGRAGPLRADAAVRADAVRDAGVHLSPAVGVEAGGRLSAFARVGQGFRVPSFHDLYVASPLATQARDVRPERVLLDAELGLRVAHRSLAGSGALFARHTRDAIVWLPGSFSWSPRNVTSERASGAEGRISAAGEAVSVEGWAAIYRTRASIDGFDVPTPYAPRSAGGAAARAALGSFGATASLTAIGRRQFVTAPAARSLELPGVALLDLTVSHRFRARAGTVLTTAGVRNVGDVRWEPVRRFPAPGRSWIAALTITN